MTRSLRFLPALALVAACSGGTDDANTDTTTDAGTTTTTDGGTTETAISIRVVDTSVPVTTTVTPTYAPPPCPPGVTCKEGGETITYPDGDKYDQSAAVWDRSDRLTVAVARKSMVKSGNNPAVEVWNALGFEIPRTGTGSVDCSATGTAKIWTGATHLIYSVGQSGACSFDVVKNTQTAVKIEFKTALTITSTTNGGTWTIPVGTIEVATKAGSSAARTISAPLLSANAGQAGTLLFNTGVTLVDAAGTTTIAGKGQIPQLGVNGVEFKPGTASMKLPTGALGAFDCGKTGNTEIALDIEVRSDYTQSYSSKNNDEKCTLFVPINGARKLFANATLTKVSGTTAGSDLLVSSSNVDLTF